MDAEIRAALFPWLSYVTDGGERPLSWQQLTQGFRFRGETITLIGSKGIWKPAQMRLPVSIVTAPPKSGRAAPYDDAVTDEGLLRYRYEGADRNGYRNVWLRECWRAQIPLVYLYGVSRGLYLVTWPALIVEDRPEDLAVLVALLDPARVRPDLGDDVAEAAVRRFETRLTKQRLEQGAFRARVLLAYKTSCAMCRLRHSELLDAAHIVPYAENGPSVVSNGLALCKIHHAAYDHDIIGVRPDRVIQLREDMLEEIDGPMLRHGLQEIHGQTLIVPRARGDQPGADFLERRWSRFVSG